MSSSLQHLEGISEKDRLLIQEAETLLGPDPEEMGFVKNMFWGRIQKSIVFPYPQSPEEERNACQTLLTRLESYLEKEHPRVQIDQEEVIPRWVIQKLFDLGIMGMTIPREYGGLGLGITSYNKILERIGAYCSSTAVLVSAHQSIGCKAIMLFGTADQKQKWLPVLATHVVSAFCLSEPNVGSDAGGQETLYEISPDGGFFILNGEKKWATSGALSGMFTVIAREKQVKDQGKQTISAFICTPEMEGVEITQKNRSKCGIRGTWQARIRFKNVKIPRENLLHEEGKGLKVALSCLDYGRATLSAGMIGAAKKAMWQGVKWSQTRFQFQRPLCEFELIQKKIAEMSALSYAMDAMLYIVTGFLDRHEKDIMLETAICKVFCSEMGWRVINHAVQIMGGESYMTENELERAFRDSRIFLIVEGSNEVMQSFIFGYGGKQIAEHLLSLQQAFVWKKKDSTFSNLKRVVRNYFRPRLLFKALGTALAVISPFKPAAPRFELNPELASYCRYFAFFVRDLNWHFKKVSIHYKEQLLSRQNTQARIADAAMWGFAYGCVLSKFEVQRPKSEVKKDKDYYSAIHFLEMAKNEIELCWRALRFNTDSTQEKTVQAILRFSDTLPNESFIIPEKSPNAFSTGRTPNQNFIRQF